MNPISTQKVPKTKSCARVLTSAECIAIANYVRGKGSQKQEEKERTKKERELKKAAREEEKKQKAN